MVKTFMKFGMDHYILKFYKVYINDDSELSLTHFKTMSNTCCCTYTRPRYQMTFYRTICPLVIILVVSHVVFKDGALFLIESVPGQCLSFTLYTTSPNYTKGL